MIHYHFILHAVISVVVDYLVRYRSAVRRFIHGSSCQKAVLVAILVNTLSMGIEHHEQVRILSSAIAFYH